MKSKIPTAPVDEPIRRSGRVSKDRLECDYCNQTFSTHSNLAYHEHVHKLHKHEPKLTVKSTHECKQCKKVFSCKHDFKNHVCSLSSDDSQTLYHCKVCRKPFTYKNHLSMHMENHKTKQPFECEYCGMGFNKKDEVDQHRYSHLENEAVECLQCSKMFSSKLFLDNHERVHQWLDTLEEPFVCDDSKLINQCERKIPNPTININFCPLVVVVDATQNHQVKDNGETEAKVVIETKIKQDDIIEEGNGLKSDRQSNVVFIASNMSAISISSGSTKDNKPEKCEVSACEESKCVEQSNNYQLGHIIEGNFIKCTYCEMTFHENDKKLIHECLEHKPQIILRHCDATVGTAQKDQGKDYSQNNDEDMEPIVIKDNESDMLNVSEPEEVPKSPIAHRTRATQANRHQISTPNVVAIKKSSIIKGKLKRIFICNLCNIQFKTSTNFQRHKIIHTKKRPYKCRYCNATYRRSDHKLRHERKIHPR